MGRRLIRFLLLVVAAFVVLTADSGFASVQATDAAAAARPETRVRANPGSLLATVGPESGETLATIGQLRQVSVVSVSATGVAANTVDDLVRFDPEWASRQIAGQNLPGSTGYATTPGGNTLSVHAAERTFLGGPGRAPIEPSLIDDILLQGTRVTYRGINDTVKVSAPNLCGRCYVVVDAQTGTHVVTVMVPK